MSKANRSSKQQEGCVAQEDTINFGDPPQLKALNTLLAEKIRADLTPALSCLCMAMAPVLVPAVAPAYAHTVQSS